ncbi:MAG: DUF2267 domain-containing protein [Chloroflexi bacterium]|nr:DUF2267 domain-containing protein [Chloroflexota bacterium]
MATTGLDVFDTTVQKTNEWLHELMGELGWQDQHRAYAALRATLHALRDRLTVDEVAQLGAQLPMLVRGFYYEGWDPSRTPLRERHREQFLTHVRQELRGDPAPDVEAIVRAVFAVLGRRVTRGEVEDVRHLLPAEIRDLWP